MKHDEVKVKVIGDSIPSIHIEKLQVLTFKGRKTKWDEFTKMVKKRDSTVYDVLEPYLEAYCETNF